MLLYQHINRRLPNVYIEKILGGFFLYEEFSIILLLFIPNFKNRKCLPELVCLSFKRLTFKLRKS